MRSFANNQDCFFGAAFRTEEAVVQMKFRKAVVAKMSAMIGSTARTAHAVLAPVAERKMRKAVLFHFLFGRQLRAQDFGWSTRPSFFILTIKPTQCGVLNSTKLNQLGTYG